MYSNFEHRSFTFQEFSQRYADSSQLGVIPIPEYRRQDTKNRQNSTDDLDPFIKEKMELQTKTLFDSATALYEQMLKEALQRNVLEWCCPSPRRQEST